MKKILAIFLCLFVLSSQGAFAFWGKSKKIAVPEGSGYLGTLPDVTQRFQTALPELAKPSFEYQDGFNNPNEIKPAPRQNPAFINIIMKKDKSSQYVNDLNEIISITEKLQGIIENQGNVQQFNAQSYFLLENVKFFRDKYKGKAEQSYISFKEVMNLNTHVQSVSRLRLESETFSPYVTQAQSGNMFSQNNLDVQLNYLLDNIKESLVVLKEVR